MSGLEFEMTATRARLLSASSACYSDAVKRSTVFPISSGKAAALLGIDKQATGKSRLKGGCSQEWLPHGAAEPQPKTAR